MASEIPEIVDAFAPQLNAFMAVRIFLCILVVSCSSFCEDSVEIFNPFCLLDNNIYLHQHTIQYIINKLLQIYLAYIGKKSHRYDFSPNLSV